MVNSGEKILPWTTEFRNACEKAGEILEDRQLIVDLKSPTAISYLGENLLASLINEGIKLCRKMECQAAWFFIAQVP